MKRIATTTGLLLGLMLIMSTHLSFSQDIEAQTAKKGNNLQLRTPLRPESPTTLVTVLPGNGSSSGNGRAPQGSRLFNNTKYLITGAEMTASGFGANAITSIGWRWNVPRPTAAGAPTAQSVATTGNLKVFVKDTTSSATALIGTFIDTNGVGYTKIIDGTISITRTDTVEFSIDVPVGGPGTSPFTTTPGNGLLIIYVYNTTTPLSTTSPTVFCTTTLASPSLLTYQSNVANGTTGTATNFRPETRIGNSEVDYVNVKEVFAHGKLPIPYGNVDTLMAAVKNENTVPATFDMTVTVKEAVSGVVRFTNTQTITALAAGVTTAVTWGWSPTIAENDSIIVTAAAVSGETNTANNRKAYYQNVNANTYAHNNLAAASSSVGYNTGSGLFLSRFHVTGTRTVSQVNAFISNSSTNTGNTIYGVVLNSAGTIIGQSANVVVAAPDNGTWKSFTFTTPPTVTNEDIYIGMAQTANATTGYFPLAVQTESPGKPNAYFGAALAGGAYTNYTTLGRYMIEGVVTGTPTVDGNLIDDTYTTIGAKQNSNSGFGPLIDVSKIVYYSDIAAQKLYIGVVGKFDITNNNNIGIFLNVSGPGSPTGKASGQSLGIQSGGGGYIGANNDPANVNFKAGFEVDYMFAFNPGGGGTDVYFDAAKHVGSSVIEYQGNCNQSGTTALNANATGSIFPANSISFAVNNDGNADHGIEICIPWSAIGADGNMSIQAFAFVVSGTAFFSDVTVPGNAPTALDANPGFNTDFSTLAGGPYYTNPASPLPIQLSSFTAQQLPNQSVRLDWTTRSEINNYGFYVQRREANESAFSTIPNSFIAGHGTSNTTHYYGFIDNAAGGVLQYRLKQQDLDGSIYYSEPIQVNGVTGIKENVPKEFALYQNYPNPFNPSTEIKFSVESASQTILNVYNVLGQRVATLFNDRAEAGQLYTVRLDAANLASGMYFYQLQSGTRSALKKMLLMK